MPPVPLQQLIEGVSELVLPDATGRRHVLVDDVTLDVREVGKAAGGRHARWPSGPAPVADPPPPGRARAPEAPRSGTLFVARRGYYGDGHAWIDHAIARGAVAVAVTRRDAIPRARPVPFVLLPDERGRHVATLARRVHGDPTARLRVAGVTGTNGKTTVTWTLAHLLEALGRRTAWMTSLGYGMRERTLEAVNTTPDSVFVQRFARDVLDQGATHLVLEVSSHALALERTYGVSFDCVGLTCVTRDHLDLHGSIEAYRQTKALLLHRELHAGAAKPQRTAVAWAAGEQERAILAGCRSDVQRIAAVDHPDTPIPPGAARLVVRVLEDAGLDGLRVAIATEGLARNASLETRLPYVGRFQAANLAVALGMLAALEPDAWVEACAAIPELPRVPGRMEPVVVPQAERTVLVDHAHTPDAVARVTQTVAASMGRAPWVVLGCGGDRDRGKRAPMAEAATEAAAHVVLTSDNPRSEPAERIVADMLAGVPPGRRDRVTTLVDRIDAIDHAVRHAGAHPVLVLGRGAERWQHAGGRRIPLQDAREVRRALLGCVLGVPSSRHVPYLSEWSPERLRRLLGVAPWVNAGALPFRGITYDKRRAGPGWIVIHRGSPPRRPAPGAWFIVPRLPAWLTRRKETGFVRRQTVHRLVVAAELAAAVLDEATAYRRTPVFVVAEEAASAPITEWIRQAGGFQVPLIPYDTFCLRMAHLCPADRVVWIVVPPKDVRRGRVPVPSWVLEAAADRVVHVRKGGLWMGWNPAANRDAGWGCAEVCMRRDTRRLLRRLPDTFDEVLAALDASEGDDPAQLQPIPLPKDWTTRP